MQLVETVAAISMAVCRREKVALDKEGCRKAIPINTGAKRLVVVQQLIPVVFIETVVCQRIA